MDVVGFGPDGARVSFGNGDGTFQARVLGTPFFGSAAEAGQWFSNNQHPRYVADVNDDGAGDIVGFAVPGVLVSLSNGDIWG